MAEMKAATDTGTGTPEGGTTQQGENVDTGTVSEPTGTPEGGETAHEEPEPADLEGWQKRYKDLQGVYTKTSQEFAELKKTHVPRTELEKFQRMAKEAILPPNPFTGKLEAAKKHEAEIRAELKEIGDSPELERQLADAELRREFYEDRWKAADAEVGTAVRKALGEEKALKIASPEFADFCAQDNGLAKLYALHSHDPEIMGLVLGMFDAFTGNRQTQEAKAALDAQAAERRKATQAPGGAGHSEPVGPTTFTESQIAAMTPAEFAKNRTAILAAEKAGKIRPG